jgi:hypothetical protein
LNPLLNRAVVWGLASTTFTCLLGHFYDFWTMRLFACWVLPPAGIVLGCIAYLNRKKSKGIQNPSTWIVQGTIGGIFAALIYDLFRLPFVMAGYPLFAVFPKFGQMLLAAESTDFGWAVQTAGWTYHFANGASLGMMYLAMQSQRSPRWMFWGAVLWASTVEILLLLTPYYSFFNLKLPFHLFIILTMSAHVVFGMALGWWCRRKISFEPVAVRV